jgi:hypothetical protein
MRSIEQKRLETDLKYGRLGNTTLLVFGLAISVPPFLWPAQRWNGAGSAPQS